MKTLFGHLHEFETDFYVADYTEPAKTHPEFGGRKVEITAEKPEIAGLCFQNPRHIVSFAANFEKNHAVFEVDGKKVSQCECGCFAHGDNPWLAFVEMKYCHENNVLKNAQNALAQVEATYQHLCDNYAEQMTAKKYKIYFIVSIPEHSSHAPFLVTQDEKLRLHDKKINLIDSNKVEIATASHLFQK